MASAHIITLVILFACQCPHRGVRRPLLRVELQARVAVPPAKRHRCHAERPVGQVPHSAQRTALLWAHDGEEGLQGHHDEDGDAHLGVERVKGIEAVDSYAERRGHAEDGENLGGRRRDGTSTQEYGN